jgi:hypothetical protein
VPLFGQTQDLFQDLTALNTVKTLLLGKISRRLAPR